MAISTPYASGTVSSVSGTTFTASASTFVAGDVGRLIILTGGNGKLQHRKITAYTSATVVTVDHAWDATPWLNTVADVAPSNGDAFAVSYLQTDAAFTGEAGVTVSGEQIDISALAISGNGYVHMINAQVDLDSDGIEISNGGGLIFGWYKYIAGEDAQVRDSCQIIDRTAQTTDGNQMAPSEGVFGMLDIYGGIILRDNGSINFWRCYHNADSSLCQCRWIDVQCFGDAGLGSRVDGDRSIIITEQVGARTSFGICNPRTAVSRVEITAVDCDQAGYVWLDATSGGPEGRLVFKRLNSVLIKVIRVLTSGASGTKVMEVIGKKSEIDAVPAFLNCQNTVAGQTFRYGNLILPSFFDTSAVKITDNIKTVLKDVNETIVNTETLTTGDYTEYFARHSDVGCVKGDRDLSDGTQYAPYTLNCILYDRNVLSQSISLEDTFEAPLTMLPDTLITQSTKATVDAYTTHDDAYEAYDGAKALLYDGFAGESEVLIGRAGAQLDFDTGSATEIVIDSAASSSISYATNTLTLKSSAFTGGATGTGTVTIQGATAISNARYDCDIDYSSSATTLTNITCTGTLDFDTAGTYTLDACDINEVTNSSGGAVTLILTNNSIVTTNTGPNITIQEQRTASVTSIVPGSRIQVYNVTTATECCNEIVPTDTYTNVYNAGDVISDGDTIRVRLTCQSGLSSCDWFEFSVASTSLGFSLVAAQEELTAYPDLGVDGSTVTEYSLDGTNIEVDANDLDGQSTKKRLVAWYYYIGTTEEGIRTFFDGIELEDSGNAKIVTSIVDLTVDNTSSVQLEMTDSDFRLYRDDGETWIEYPSTGGYGISSDVGKVFVEPVNADILANEFWNTVLVNQDKPNGSAGEIVENLPKIIARKADL